MHVIHICLLSRCTIALNNDDQNDNATSVILSITLIMHAFVGKPSVNLFTYSLYIHVLKHNKNTELKCHLWSSADNSSLHTLRECLALARNLFLDN